MPSHIRLCALTHVSVCSNTCACMYTHLLGPVWRHGRDLVLQQAQLGTDLLRHKVSTRANELASLQQAGGGRRPGVTHRTGCQQQAAAVEALHVPHYCGTRQGLFWLCSAGKNHSRPKSLAGLQPASLRWLSQLPRSMVVLECHSGDTCRHRCVRYQRSPHTSVHQGGPTL